jgi:hypothetical protein
MLRVRGTLIFSANCYATDVYSSLAFCCVKDYVFAPFSDLLFLLRCVTSRCKCPFIFFNSVMAFLLKIVYIYISTDSRVIAFQARANIRLVNIAKHQVVKFGYVITNKGKERYITTSAMWLSNIYYLRNNVCVCEFVV